MNFVHLLVKLATRQAAYLTLQKTSCQFNCDIISPQCLLTGFVSCDSSKFATAIWMEAVKASGKLMSLRNKCITDFAVDLFICLAKENGSAIR